jgi:chaperonin cofactor prefoldin
VLFRVSLSGINVDVEPVYELLDMQVSTVRPEIESVIDDLKSQTITPQGNKEIADIKSLGDQITEVQTFLTSKISNLQSQMSQGDQSVSTQIDQLRAKINNALKTLTGWINNVGNEVAALEPELSIHGSYISPTV